MTTTVQQPTTNRLWTRNFGLYFIGRQVSRLTDSMLPFALSVTLLGLGYSAGVVGVVLASWMAPFALLVLFGGVLADRIHPRPIMVGADLVRLAVQAGLAIALISGAAVPLWVFISGSIVNGAATAMFQPGVSSMVPQVADDVQRANGVLRMAEGAAGMAGPALGGVIVAVTGTGAIFAICAVAFGVSAVALALLRELRPASAVVKEAPIWRNLADGWQEFRSRTWLWTVILLWMLFGVFVFGPWIPLGAASLIEAQGKSAYGFAEAAFGAGLVVGGLVATRFRPRRLLFAGGIAMFLFAAGPLAAAVAGPLPLVLVGFFTAGSGWAFWGVNWTTAVQTHVPADKLNRVYAYDVAGSIVAVPVGQVLAGPYLTVLGLHSALYTSAAMAVLITTVLVLAPAVRDLRRVEQPAR